MFPRYVQYLLTDFRQTFVTGASRDRDELIAFWGQKVKCQGQSMTTCAREFYASATCPVSVDGFRQTFVTGASRDRDELMRFWGQKVKVQGHTIVAEAHSTRRYRQVQIFLVILYLPSTSLLQQYNMRFSHMHRCRELQWQFFTN